MHGPPVYVRKEIVHNKHVVEQLAERGAIFVEEETEVPEGELVVFSAHGVAPSVHANAADPQPADDRRHLPAGDQGPRRGAQVRRAGLHDRPHRPPGPRGGRGDHGRGAREHRPGRDDRRRRRARARRSRPRRLHHPDDALGRRDGEIIARLRERFPNITAPKSDDICYATTNRQIAVKQLARECELVLVIGSTNSSNSNRLVEVAREHGAASHLIDNATQVDEAWLEGVETVGITSGASAPEELVAELVEFFRARGADGRLGAAGRRRGRPLHAAEEDPHRARRARLSRRVSEPTLSGPARPRAARGRDRDLHHGRRRGRRRPGMRRRRPRLPDRRRQLLRAPRRDRGLGDRHRRLPDAARRDAVARRPRPLCGACAVADRIRVQRLSHLPGARRHRRRLPVVRRERRRDHRAARAQRCSRGSLHRIRAGRRSGEAATLTSGEDGDGDEDRTARAGASAAAAAGGRGGGRGAAATPRPTRRGRAVSRRRRGRRADRRQPVGIATRAATRRSTAPTAIDDQLKGLPQDGIDARRPERAGRDRRVRRPAMPVCAAFSEQVIPKLIDDEVRAATRSSSSRTSTSSARSPTTPRRRPSPPPGRGATGVHRALLREPGNGELRLRHRLVPGGDREGGGGEEHRRVERRPPRSGLDRRAAAVRDEAAKLGFNATPSFLVDGPGGQKTLVAPPLEQLEAAVRAVA